MTSTSGFPGQFEINIVAKSKAEEIDVVNNKKSKETTVISTDKICVENEKNIPEHDDFQNANLTQKKSSSLSDRKRSVSQKK